MCYTSQTCLFREQVRLPRNSLHPCLTCDVCATHHIHPKPACIITSGAREMNGAVAKSALLVSTLQWEKMAPSGPEGTNTDQSTVLQVSGAPQIQWIQRCLAEASLPSLNNYLSSKKTFNANIGIHQIGTHKDACQHKELSIWTLVEIQLKKEA